MINFYDLFPDKKPIIGMIHLSGNDDEKIDRALEELLIYEEESIDGAIVEDYHGNLNDVITTLKLCQGKYENIVIGVNVLRNPYYGFRLAHEMGAKFIQFDSVQTPDLNLEVYDNLRKSYPDIAVLGGIGFKYTRPTGNLLQADLFEGKLRCEAVVTTGEGTGIETPSDKLKEYKSFLKDFPLIVGAGVNVKNAYEQLMICDGAIVGSYFKYNSQTHNHVDRLKVRTLMETIKEIR